jgi:hypothetical protein
MKKIALLALFTIAFAMTSCEAEEIPETFSVHTKDVLAADNTGKGTIRP